MKQRALTMIEIVVAMVIIATVFLGLLATFVSVRRYVSRANSRLTAVNVGRQVLNDLYRGVRADQWHSSPGGFFNGSSSSSSVDGFSYVYNRTDAAAKNINTTRTSDYMEIRVTINPPDTD